MRWHGLLCAVGTLALIDGRSSGAAATSSTIMVEQTLVISSPSPSPSLPSESTSPKTTTVVVTIATRDGDAVAGKDGALGAILPSIASVEGGVAITIRPPPTRRSCKELSSSNSCDGAAANNKRLPVGPDGPMFSDEWESAGVTARYDHVLRGLPDKQALQ